ncbi:hypothetical protein BGX34_007589 [Mortierella sp. NVP85]|nr:hypothetical protein BGX34_007580 [Mortierella sp. NVP85]KAF9365922.1 hypothetical protein BGX34_007589 [Mortierella sp. NVP85]
MVSKLVGLSLLAALACHVNAYTWYAHLVYKGTGDSLTATKFKIHPVDVQIPGNDQALIWEGDINDPPLYPPYDQFGYAKVDLGEYGQELEALSTTRAPRLVHFPCTKIEQFEQQGPSDTIFTWKVYSCANSDYDGKEGIRVPPPTTTTAVPVTTTSCPAVTVTVPVTVTTTNPPKPTTTPPKPTTTPPKPSPTCLAGYRGKGNGKGPDGVCCSHSDDCKDTCVKGICRDRCLTGYEGKRNGKGPNGACCSHSNDCKDTCVKGICGVHP